MEAAVSKNTTPAAEVSQNAGFAFPRWARSIFFRAPRLAWEAIFGKSKHLKDESQAENGTGVREALQKKQKTHSHAGPERKKN